MNLRFYVTTSGRTPVLEHLRSLPLEQRKIAGKMIRAIQSGNLSSPGVDAKPIKGKLWELRPSYQRIFYVVISGETVVLLHAYEKDTEQAPRHEIAIATKRMEEVLRADRR